jgi:hypothetical protein
VYVNDQGRARELCADEREYLGQKHDPFDGPAFVYRYRKLDAVEFERGFIERRCLPPEVEIIKLTPEEDRLSSDGRISLNQVVFVDRCPARR